MPPAGREAGHEQAPHGGGPDRLLPPAAAGQLGGHVEPHRAAGRSDRRQRTRRRCPWRTRRRWPDRSARIVERDAGEPLHEPVEPTGDGTGQHQPEHVAERAAHQAEHGRLDEGPPHQLASRPTEGPDDGRLPAALLERQRDGVADRTPPIPRVSRATIVKIGRKLASTTPMTGGGSRASRTTTSSPQRVVERPPGPRPRGSPGSGSDVDDVDAVAPTQLVLGLRRAGRPRPAPRSGPGPARARSASSSGTRPRFVRRSAAGPTSSSERGARRRAARRRRAQPWSHAEVPEDRLDAAVEPETTMTGTSSSGSLEPGRPARSPAPAGWPTPRRRPTSIDLNTVRRDARPSAASPRPAGARARPGPDRRRPPRCGCWR